MLIAFPFLLCFLLCVGMKDSTSRRLKCWLNNPEGISQYAGMKQINFREGSTGSWLFPQPGSSSFNFTAHRSPSGSTEVTPGEGMGWHILNEDCRLLDLMSEEAIKKHIMMRSKETSGILFIGDSISNFESHGLCELLHIRAGSVENPAQVQNWWPGNWSGTETSLDRYHHHYGADLNHCELPSGLKMGNMFLVGLGDEGPYWMSNSFGPGVRIKEAARQWRDGVGRDRLNKPFSIPGAPFLPPSMVILSSAVWDQSGAFMRREFLNDTHRAVKVLPAKWLDEWGENFTRAIGHVKSNFNTSLIVYKTTTPPMPAHREIKPENGGIHYENGGEVHFDEAGFDALVSLTATKQINQVGRMVAKREEIFILDAEAMASWLSPRVYLRDGHHPSSLMVHDTNNFALNMLKDWLDSKESYRND